MLIKVAQQPDRVLGAAHPFPTQTFDVAQPQEELSQQFVLLAIKIVRPVVEAEGAPRPRQLP